MNMKNNVWHPLRLLLLAISITSGVASSSLSSWVDPDSPVHVQTTRAWKAGDDREYQLVFSDEFAQAGRTFQDGADPRWTAIDKNDDTNNPLHYYSSTNAYTNQDGKLTITTDLALQNFTQYNPVTETTDHVTKEVRSAMLQSWNKFCFTGGVVEISARLPGRPYTGGLWPAVWMMGNLARATYVNSTERLWPFSTETVCDDRNRDSQEINACHSAQGRGAPEIDLLEVMYISQINASMLSSSLQVAPGLAENRPILGQTPNKTWYQPQLGEGVTLNNYFYGVHVTHKNVQDNTTYEFQTDTISVNYWLDDSFWSKQHLFRIEWEPPASDGTGGYIAWFIDGQLVANIQGDELQRVSQTEIPNEPMYLLMNVAVSKDWSFPDAWFLNCKTKCWSCFDPRCSCALPEGYCDTFPSTMEIDYVRVYQATHDERQTLGCSPPSHPTADFIQAHKDRYMVPGQDEPLLPVRQGGGPCVSDADCGQGTCVASRGTCHCPKAWTGPTCLAHAIIDDDDDNFQQEANDSRGVLALLLVVVGAAVTLLFGYVLWQRNYNSERVLYDLITDMESEKAIHRQQGRSSCTTPVESSSESLALIPQGQHESGVAGASVSYQRE